MRMPEELISTARVFPSKSRLSQARRSKNHKGPSENAGQSHPQISQIVNLCNLWMGLPTNQKVSESLVHLVERVGTKQERLEVRWIVNEVGGDFEVQRSQLGLVHLSQLSG